MRANEFIAEGQAHSVICVDVQPEYSGMNDGAENSVFPEIINFVNKQTGPVLFFVNAEDQGLSGDTVQDIQRYWEDTMFELGHGDPGNEHWDDSGEYHYTEPTSAIDWRRFEIVDKGYGYFRGFMDNDVSYQAIIRLIRLLYANKLTDSRDLFYGPDTTRDEVEAKWQEFMGHEYKSWMLDEPFTVQWTSLAQLKRFNGAYIVGGARNLCLREVELLMNAFNIKYKRIDSLVYD